MDLNAHRKDRPCLWLSAKTSRVMKFLAVMLFALAMQVHAKTEAQFVTLNIKKKQLSKVFSEIRKQTGYEFIISMQLLSNAPAVSVNVNNAPVQQALDECLKGLDLGYEIDKKTIIIKKLSPPAQVAADKVEAAPVINIRGRILDETGQPVVASVIVKGTNLGTTSDVDGYFELRNIADNAVLIITATNIEKIEWPVNGRAELAISVKTSSNPLNEVVVVAYGEKSRRLLTESIGTVDAKDIQKLPVASADAAIQGRVSGVQISNVDGTPGSPVAVRIRGVGTVGNTQPLFIIDGVQVGNGSPGDGRATNPLATLNPSDIDNVSVLKDASAIAAYGMRAANGVVLITTKRGKSGKARVALDAYYGVQQFPKHLATNNTQQYLALGLESINNRNAQDNLNPGDAGYRVLHPDLLPGTPNSVTGIYTDWEKASINKNAPIANTNVSVSGGNDNASYYFSVGYFTQEAITKGWNLDRYSLRSNSDFKIGKRLKIGQTLALSFQQAGKGMNGGGDGFLYANNLSMPPIFKIYDDQHTIPGNRYGYNGNAGVAGFTIGNQLALNELVRARDQNSRLLGGIYAELEIINGLKARSAASIDLSFSRNTNWQPGFTAAEIGYGREANNFSDARGEGYNQVFTNTLNYGKSIGAHTFDILAGIEYQKLRSNVLSYTGSNFQSTDPAFYQSVTNGRGSNGIYPNAGSSLSNEAYASYFGRLSYNFNQKYILTATVRRDGTSRFSPDKRWGTFPAFSAAWIISEESFFHVPFIDNLKLRGSWGQAGNSLTSNFAYISRVNFTPQYPLGGIPAQAPISPSLPNAGISWETVEVTDFGFDISMFNNKVNLLATYYNRNTKDFLYSLPVPFTSGYSSTEVNVGNVKNSGFEFDLSYNTKIGNAVNFGVNANLTTVKNRLISLAPGVQEYSSDGIYRTAVGYPIGYFYGYKVLGIYQTPAAASGALPDEVAGSNRPRAGDLIFEDNNSPLPANAEGKQFSDTANGIISPADRAYLGKTIPDFFYGVTLSADYKGFDLSILFQGVSGVQVYNQLRSSMEGLHGPGRNQLATTQNRWKGEGTSNTMPRAVDGDPYQNNRFSSRWVENAGFLRLKNIQLGYNFPASMLSRTDVFKSARIYVGATNLFVVTDYTGLDPEVVTFGNVGTQVAAGTDQGSTPQPRTFQVGLQFGF